MYILIKGSKIKTAMRKFRFNSTQCSKREKNACTWILYSRDRCVG